MTARPWSLRARLLTGVLALSALALILLASVLYLEQRRFLYDRADDQARAAVFLIDRVLNERGVAGGRGEDREPPGPLRTGGDRRLPGPPGGRPGGPAAPSGAYGERRDPRGRVLGTVQTGYREDAALSPPALPRAIAPDGLATVDAKDGSLRYRTFATRSPEGYLTVAAIPLRDTDDQLRRLILTEALLVGGVLGLIGLFGWWVIGYGLRPLDAMRETAEQIAEGDLSRRVTPAEERTEVGRLGLSLNAMLGRIEQAFGRQQASEERLRRFLADASHELRTPLASIRGYAELHRMGATKTPEEVDHAIGRIEAESARMGTLVDDLLTLARLDEPREPVREPVALDRLATDAVADARAADQSGRTITVSVPEEPAEVLGDGDELRKVLGNLLRNAVVHTPGGTPVEVAVERDRAHGVVRLSVRDHGPGLPEGDPAALFGRFWRASPGRERGPAGAGLGLAIVDAVIAGHGGTVRAEQADGGGARFVVELPALPGPSHEPSGEPSGSSEGSGR